MAFVSAVTGDDSTKKFMDVLQNDFKTLSLETKKKYPQIREACDEAIEKLALASNNPQASLYGVVNQILYPLVQGCESKDIKIIKFCLGTIQRLIAQQGIDAKGARHVVDCLYNLGQAGVLELKLLQTAALLMTTSDLVHGDTLARTMVMCMRTVSASEARDVSTSHAAAATVRQLVALVFERALAEADGKLKVNPADVRLQTNTRAPKELKPCATDAYLILQDIIQLINGDAAHWLVGISDVPKTFGLELLDTVLTDFSEVFFKIQEFRFLLKEHVCALIIRLFSPNVKYRAAFTALHIPGGGGGGAVAGAGAGAGSPAPERPHFPVTMRLLRLVSIIVHKYHEVLVTECEIFLSLTIKFLDPDKPLWQRALALEVLHKMTIQPHLLKAFCECYDMKPHATNIFQDIVNALGAYVQSLFVANQLNQQLASSGLPQQAGFYWKGVWLPLCVTFEPGTAKSVYIEMLDRSEAPSIQEGYGISVAYACLMEIIRSIAISVEGDEYFRLQELYEDIQNDSEEIISSKNGNNNKEVESTTESTDISNNGHRGEPDQNSNVVQKINTEIEEKEKLVMLQLIKSSWCGLVWGLSVLAEASIGELENILCAIQTLARVSGKVGVSGSRDACVAALCRAALPAQYCVPVLGALGALACPWAPAARAPHPSAPDLRHHVVWVGTPLPCAQLPTGQQQSFVMVTSRHVTAMKALLSAARRDGDTIQQAWLPVLTTLQHLVWILGLKPSTGGSMKASRASADANAVMSTSAVMADLPGQQVPVAESLGVMSALSAMLSRVFESSKNLDDVALHHLIDALCKLSNEAMELAYSNREPSLFAVAKLLETGLANMHRIEVMWRPITNHLLEVCQHPHIRMREWGVEAITYLVQAAFQYHHAHPALVTDGRQRLLLEPLAELCGVRHCDVRARQLECAARLLHSRGDQLGAAWPLMVDIISAVSERHSEQLVRSAFQCAQLVAGDLLGCAGPRCLRRVLAAAAAFARQTKELNISLTAVGLMWNISDYLYHNRDKLSAALASDPVCPELPHHADLPPLDKLWMCLYIRLSELCTEARAPVRRAASQTLFSCIGAHGTLLSKPAWRALLNVLFPMLDQVQKQSNIASSEKVDTGEHILIHHTRNTAQKQWAETQVLTLSGVSRVFHSRFQLLTGVGDFQRSWAALLDYITDFALRRSHEVSLAALKSFQEVVSAAGRAESGAGAAVWPAAWAAWSDIAASIGDQQPVLEEGKPAEAYAPSQNFLTTLVQIFPLIFQHIRSTFTANDVQRLGACLSRVCAAEPASALAAGAALTPAAPVTLHALHCLEALHKEALSRHELLPALFAALTGLAGACGARPERGERAGARCLAAAAALYRAAPQHSKQQLPLLLQALHSAVQKGGSDKKRRNSDPQEDATQIASLLLQVLATGLPLAREKPDDYEEFWEILPTVLETFMFEPPVGGGRQARELVGVVREEVLRGAPRTPPRHAHRVLALLRAAALHAQPGPAKNEQELREREEFARTCFETLLQFSMMEDIDSLTGGDGEADPLAIMPLLDRFQEVVSMYTSDEENTEPLPRHQLSEISFVLKAIASLTEAMKRAPPGKVDATAWDKLIGVYPALARLAASGRAGGAGGAGPALREALLQFAALLAAPRPAP
ncbi:PREDICTED: protein MON2 homolog isoform X1 [Papilio polytes]|uniref:protein MON2 homolog isoform X1 n=1 Tax=Papilio polytes TaxID=76194 RepID=UPI0006768BD1|nr:PREDICTED: protein MON2 homolog isoform X1 [Papilio polytes]XP_013148972.1 PREDICTED: protein MON2 homolog isoform X1 [Papilio polytes]